MGEKYISRGDGPKSDRNSTKKKPGPHPELLKAVAVGQSPGVAFTVRHSLPLLTYAPLLSVAYSALVMVFVNSASLALGLIVGPNLFLNLQSFNRNWSFLMGTMTGRLSEARSNSYRIVTDPMPHMSLRPYPALPSLADLPFLLLLPNVFYIVSYLIYISDASTKLIKSLSTSSDVCLATLVCASISLLISLYHIYASISTRLSSRRALSSAGIPVASPLYLFSGLLRWELFPLSFSTGRRVIKDVPIKIGR